MLILERNYVIMRYYNEKGRVEMKIVIVSDTHGNSDSFYEIVSRNQTADLVIHLGDGEREFEDIRNAFPLIAFLSVRGNNDWGNALLVNTINLEGHRIYMTHGHRFDGMSIASYVAAVAKENECKIALFGHTHVPFYEIKSGVHVFNPGSPSRPRGRCDASFGLLELEQDKPPRFRHISTETWQEF